MPSDNLTPFANQKYLNIESFRRDGRAVRTPVWFAQSGERLYIYSLADAGKVKRIRNNPRVRVVPCDARGKVKGEWVEATARIESGAGEELGNKALDEKYGWLKQVGNFFSRLRGKRHAIISIGLT
ncbi:MAG TPA: PPOX class F420-dependent oxidoreductase [Blastocatellia bacterium]